MRPADPPPRIQAAGEEAPPAHPGDLPLRPPPGVLGQGAVGRWGRAPVPRQARRKAAPISGASSASIRAGPVRSGITHSLLSARPRRLSAPLPLLSAEGLGGVQVGEKPLGMRATLDLGAVAPDLPG